MTPEVIQTAKRALEMAATERGIKPSSDALRFMLAQVLAESAFGAATSTLRGTNNYGAIHSTDSFRRAHAGKANWGEIAHQDHLASGKRYIEWFRLYPSQLDGARDFVATVSHLTNLAELSSADQYARDLYEGHYFVGFGQTDEERITGYKTFIEAHLPAIDAGLRANALPSDPSAVSVGPFATLLERLYVKTDDVARTVYGKAFDDVLASGGVRWFAANAAPPDPGPSPSPTPSPAPSPSPPPTPSRGGWFGLCVLAALLAALPRIFRLVRGS